MCSKLGIMFNVHIQSSIKLIPFSRPSIIYTYFFLLEPISRSSDEEENLLGTRFIEIKG